MTHLELADIQGNIHKPYGRFGFPHTRHLLFNIANPEAGRNFVEALRPHVTTAEPWKETADGRKKKPTITLNIGFTFRGLLALDLPTRTLRLLPDEFIDGMGCRAAILGDIGNSAPSEWNPVWRDHSQVHVWISFSAAADPNDPELGPHGDLAAWTDRVLKFATDSGGVTLLKGHSADGSASWQDSSALKETLPDGRKKVCPREHFGFRDGVGDPVFRGQLDDATERVAVLGGGKIGSGPYQLDKSWSALETGEFILGKVDEGQELPVATQPQGFARNGTFMAYRKLSQDVNKFEGYVQEQAARWQTHIRVTSGRSPTQKEAVETIYAKMVGRWRSGIPLMLAANWQEHEHELEKWKDCFELEDRGGPRNDLERQRLALFYVALTGFRYGDDPSGARCPLGSHIRRAHPRDMLDPDVSDKEGASTLTNRRRILRRGLPYEDKDGEKGVAFMAICSSLFRQFEFVQQQWMNYGLDFEAGNDTCPIIGNRPAPDKLLNKFVIPAGPANDVPFIAANLPEFVTTRGGEYFFLPSMTAIRMIAMGVVDPT